MAQRNRASIRGRGSPTATRSWHPALAAVVALATLGIAPPANACSPPLSMPSLAERVDEIAVAFVGRQIERIDDAGVTLVFEVDRLYHGEAGPLIEVRTAYGGGDCGISFRDSGTVGIIAYRRGETGWWVAEEGDLMVSSWHSTATIRELEEVFGVGYPPNETLSVETPDTHATEPPDTSDAPSRTTTKSESGP